MFSAIQYSKIIVPVNRISLKGNLSVPQNAGGIVIFAHGSGSGRNSPRNKMVASILNSLGFATLLFDLLTEEEEKDIRNRFNISLLAQRLREVSGWILGQEKFRNLHMGYFGASTGAAAALKASKDLTCISAIVSRGGRPDLAMEDLPFVTSPTLFIVGEKDVDVLDLNKKAFQKLSCEKKLEVIPGATHLFEEKGAMEKIAFMAANWFSMHLHPLTLTH